MSATSHGRPLPISAVWGCPALTDRADNSVRLRPSVHATLRWPNTPTSSSSTRLPRRRSWDADAVIIKTLQDLEDDETLLVQSGRPVGVFRTHESAPRVLIANANLVPEWANWDEFRRLERLGLTMYGQMTAGSWIYIGTQGILQGTYETFRGHRRQTLRRELGRDVDGDLRRRRYGWRPASGRNYERRRRPLLRRGPEQGRAPAANELPRHRCS